MQVLADGSLKCKPGVRSCHWLRQMLPDNFKSLPVIPYGSAKSLTSATMGGLVKAFKEGECPLLDRFRAGLPGVAPAGPSTSARCAATWYRPPADAGASSAACGRGCDERVWQ